MSVGSASFVKWEVLGHREGVGLVTGVIIFGLRRGGGGSGSD